MVVIIRPSFKKLCDQDACRAALLNHLLYWIARRAKGQETEKIKSGEVSWYGSYQDICSTGLDDSWSMWKVRKELKALVNAGLLGQRHNRALGFDREYQYFFGKEQGKVLKDLCEKQGINLLDLGLCDDVLHLLKTADACAENTTCICRKQQMHVLNSSDASAENSRAIPKDSTKIPTKDSTKREHNPTELTAVATHALTSPSNDQTPDEIVSVPETTQEQHSSGVPPVEAPPTVEGTESCANDQHKQNDTTVNTSDKSRSNRGKSLPSSEALLLLDAWDEINGRRLTRTKEQIDATEELARINATADDLKHVRDRLLSQKDGFWKARGVSLKNVANNFHLAALGPLPPSDSMRAKTSPSIQSATAPGETHKPRKLLRRVPSATQGDLSPRGRSQEARAAQ
jgi:hypothetical protein